MSSGALTWLLPPTDQAVDRIRFDFAGRYGTDADGVWAAPGRVTIIGEHLDYNGGRSLAFALPHRTLVAVRRRSDQFVSLHSNQAPASEPAAWRGRLDDIGPDTVTGWLGYALGVPWAMRTIGFDPPGFDALVDGHVPLGSGLSSSAALTCAIAIALDAVAGFGLDDTDAGRTLLADVCMAAENLMAHAPTGGLDQTTSLSSLPGQATLIDFPSLEVEHLPLDLPGADLALLVTDTQTRHAHAEGGYGSRRDECMQVAHRLGVAHLGEITLDGLAAALTDVGSDPGGTLTRRLHHVVTEGARVDAVAGSISKADLRAIGSVLEASHASLRDDFEVSSTEQDLACSAAAGAGALGSRMIGGGFGGSCIHLVDADRVEAVAAAVHQSLLAVGHREPRFLLATPSAAASRLWPPR